jgi:serine/threonine protein kinase
MIMAVSILPTGTYLAQRYRVENLIGSGGYATVYRVFDTKTRLYLAMKEVNETDPGIREQFKLEADLLIYSAHPNIPRGYNHLEENGRAYLVMDFIEGKDLEQMLSTSMTQTGRPIDEAQALRWLLPICDVLNVMHHQPIPIIHRDIKPANIKLNALGSPILIDFGLAKLNLPGPTHSAAQGVTPGYAPPEQYLAQGKTDARSDIYALGATLYTLLTGHEPPEAPNRLLAQTGNTGKPLMPIHAYNDRVSVATERLVLRAMDINPNQRQQSARDMQSDITAALDLLENGLAVYSMASELPTNPLEPATSRPAAISAQLAIATPTRAILDNQQRFARTKRNGLQPVIPWIDLGGSIVERNGKASFVVAAFEMYWGLFCTGAMAGIFWTAGFTLAPNFLEVVAAICLVGIAIAITLLLIRALDRPIARRGYISPRRRAFFQGSLLLCWFLANWMALASYSSSGLLSLGLLGLASILIGMLSIANVLA